MLRHFLPLKCGYNWCQLINQTINGIVFVDHLMIDLMSNIDCPSSQFLARHLSGLSINRHDNQLPFPMNRSKMFRNQASIQLHADYRLNELFTQKNNYIFLFWFMLRFFGDIHCAGAGHETTQSLGRQKHLSDVCSPLLVLWPHHLTGIRRWRKSWTEIWLSLLISMSSPASVPDLRIRLSHFHCSLFQQLKQFLWGHCAHSLSLI